MLNLIDALKRNNKFIDFKARQQFFFYSEQLDKREIEC